MSEQKTKVTPQNLYVLIKPKEKETETESGILLSHKETKERPFYGQILEVSANVKQFQKGQWVHFQRLGPVGVTVDNEDLYYVLEKDVLGIVES